MRSSELPKQTWSWQRAKRRPSTTSVADAKLQDKSRRRWLAGCSLLTAAVSVGTDHRPFWCLLTDAAFGFIAVHFMTRAISAPRTATCSGSQSGASVDDSHEDTTLHHRGPTRAPREGGEGGGAENNNLTTILTKKWTRKPTQRLFVCMCVYMYGLWVFIR